MTIDLGITGTGFIVRTAHLPGIVSAGRAVLVKGFHDVNADVAESAKQAYFSLLKNHKSPLLERALQETTVYTDLGEMLDNVDAIDICTPPRYHVDALRQTVDHGKHVACEKPLARNWWAIEACKDVVAAVASKRLAFQLHTQAIWNPLIAAGKDALQAGIIGDIEKIRILHQTADPAHAVALTPLWDKHHAGGGALMDIGPHPYSVMWYWIGPGWTPVAARAERLEATIPVRTIAGIPNTRVTVEDDAHVAITWRHKDGREIQGELEATWNKKDWFLGKVGSSLEPTLYYEVHGSKGVLTFPNVTFSLGKPAGIVVGFKVTGKDGSSRLVKHPLPPKRIEERFFFEEFAATVESGVPTRNDLAFAGEMLAVFGAAYLSKKRDGAVVPVDEFKAFARSAAPAGASAEQQVSVVIDAVQ